MTDVAPSPLTEPCSPPRGRAALLVAALRGGVAVLVALWLVAATR